ncbi:adhesion G protein-coupled receptor E3-like [Amblyraja radiata]|uniref:adhesion G protein-coupled receptor E3-like n=1 Tax=Amblyraja radiata TaxID=386614 RepID=UPI001403B1FF|nr:adhesion G protein-coupled receptor E3-like [Amblyraja radiata]
MEPTLAQEGGRNGTSVKFNSKVVTVTKVGGKKQGLTPTLNITFRVKEEPGDDGNRKRLCGTWMGNGWATHQESSGNKTHATCTYNTLSSFALLLAQYKMDPVHSTALWWITLLVLPVSLLLLLLSVATFFWCKAIRGLYTLIQAHLCLNLFLAELLFLITMFIKQQSMVCALVLGSLHYLLLVAFSWMLLEAVHLWLMVLNLKVVNFTRTRVMKRRYMYPAAYLCPALVVTVAASVNPRGYWRYDRCWLDLEKGFIWSLLGPVSFVVLVNTVLFVMIIWNLRNLRNIKAALNTNVSTIKDSRIRTFKTMAQFVVLGCSWVIGLLFQLNEDTIVLSYIFTIVNVSQGVFIFLVHCLLNQQVRREYSNWFSRMCRRKKAEAADIPSPIAMSDGFEDYETVKTTQLDIQRENMGSE